MEATPYPFERPSALEVPTELGDLREKPVCPVSLPSGDTALMVTRYADVRKLLTDDRLSRNIGRPGAARISRENKMFQDPRIDPDPPEHTRVRRLVTKAFSAARIESLRPYITEVTDELLEKMEAAGPGVSVDLNETLAFPLPIQVICKLLGVPDAEYDKLRGWTEAFLSVSQIPGPQIGRSMKEMTAYIEQLVEFKRENPGEDLVSAMIRVRDENDGSLTDYELHWWIRLLLLVGYETTATQIGGGVALLLSHPEQLAALKNDWGLIPQFTEEALRWKLVGSSVSMLRFAVADIEMDGYTIPAGTSVIPAVDSANQDPTVFENPERFDIRRTSNPHLTFSLGAHFCIGAALARLQVQIATERLLKRFPTLKLSVAATELRRQPGALLEGFISIPVEW